MLLTSQSPHPPAVNVLFIIAVFSTSGNHDVIASDDDVTSHASISIGVTWPGNAVTTFSDVKAASAVVKAGAVVDNDTAVSTAGCGSTKGCLHYPAGCQSPGDCVSVLTWTTTESGFVDFEMMAPSDGWIAVALSPNTLMVSAM